MVNPFDWYMYFANIIYFLVSPLIPFDGLLKSKDYK